MCIGLCGFFFVFFFSTDPAFHLQPLCCAGLWGGPCSCGVWWLKSCVSSGERTGLCTALVGLARGGVRSLPWPCPCLGRLVCSDPWARRAIAPADAEFLLLRASRPPAFTLNLHHHLSSSALKLYQASLSTSLTLCAR